MLHKNVAIEFARKKHPVVCILLHPGTVDTGLSKPFQRNVPSEQLFTREKAAGHMLDIMGRSTLEDTGKLFAWDGSEIVW